MKGGCLWVCVLCVGLAYNVEEFGGGWVVVVVGGGMVTRWAKK